MNDKKICPIAKELNKIIEDSSNSISNMLSEFGKRMFFPKGILQQSKEVTIKAPKLKATIGMAVNNGKLLTYDYANELSVNNTKNKQNEFTLSNSEIYSYEQVSGRAELIDMWSKKMLTDNPDLKKKRISTPVPVTGITHGLFVFSDLFINEDDQIVLPELIWGNYNLIFKERRDAQFVKYPFFDNNEFNINGFKDALTQAVENSKNNNSNKVIVLLNFPNNPTGYSPKPKMLNKIKDIMVSKADDINIIVVCDDAYFGLFYDEDNENEKRQSPFAFLADAHENLLAIKLDGATKEELSWGLRVGFITFGIKNATDKLYIALNEKVKGSIRSSISSGSKIGQSLLLKILSHKEHQREKEEKTALLKSRAEMVKEILEDKRFDEVWTAYPFNSGYFMTMKLKGINAKELWQELLDNNDVGIIYLDDVHIRIAFSSIDINNLKELFEIIYRVAKNMQNKSKIV